MAQAASESGFIDGGPHDLRTRLGISRICQPCHVPHNAPEADAGPIWNHALSTQTFYREGATITLSGSSALCMGCHDGVTAVDSYGGTIGSDVVSGGANLGNDFTDDHPIGVDYGDAIAGHEFIYEAEADVEEYLEDGRIECGSCHHAHSTGKMLVTTIEGSQLCRECHKF
jgi:predicted CXXCH cytochrome family protein